MAHLHKSFFWLNDSQSVSDFLQKKNDRQTSSFTHIYSTKHQLRHAVTEDQLINDYLDFFSCVFVAESNTWTQKQMGLHSNEPATSTQLVNIITLLLDMFMYLSQMSEQQGIYESREALHEWFISTFQQTAESDKTFVVWCHESSSPMW